MKRNALLSLAAGCLICFMAGLLAPSAASAQGDYVIGAGDQLAVSVWGEDALNFSALVRPDGKITVPGVGDIKAEGHTPAELRDVLKEELSSLVRDPFVTVSMEEIVNCKAYVVGGGVQPGVYDLRQRTSLLQLLASQPLGAADLSRAYVARSGEKILTDFRSLYHEGDLSQDISLEHNDIVFIPGQREPFVYVLGAVMAPQAVPYRDSITVLDAILQSGGYNKFADKGDTVVVRRNGEEKDVIKIQGDKLMEGELEQNLVLEQGDYVIVDESYF
ncbi:polysaccharide biosynthesis/export family protein [Desulfohalovibrio reitneri]|uniref:polysaccharide biosynthesis/export family protein n=1 Tax=Desulfohalovibrio reitneri TaxID=1307759 RepID=UPI0004A6AB2B|nr:polysaccharide biosynthesis/export family protein [Desulfohalovibrio reitneri]